MTIQRRRRKFSGVTAVSIVAPVALLGLVLLGAWAWTDGGRTPVGDIVQPIPLPELPQ
ncbi:MAG: hypothetical protein K0R64_1317 [Novosphingobium lindaniclasticum]|uniref:hypothetical protein n=1 Tax=Novosphingobium lindaniclasticum TaxID=1329895 RepID=UPI00240904E9|nr:hypothetical protein [Novosphingobium lindaniclasticum]MDF2638333.1 hypothetical protein [Novosphingobium lindaniclasticum]